MTWQVRALESSLLRLKGSGEGKEGKQVREILSSEYGDKYTLLKEDFVGPVIGDQIKSDGLQAIIFSIIGILIYISMRFEFRFALGAIMALMHDVIITTGIFILSGRELNAPVLAGMLTIIGYSLNDTIVVFDRIRENLMASRKEKGVMKKSRFIEILNQSLSQTLNRTVLTSITTLFVVLILWLFGGGAVSDLAYTLVIGVIVGTYSSVFIASPALLAGWKANS